MKPPRFQLHRPRTLDAALGLLATLEDGRPIAGGQSLMPMLIFRLAQPEHLVDLGGIADLDYIRAEDGEIRIGAMTAQRSIEFSDTVRRQLPLVASAILSVGHRQTRNRGTIGGSLCHLDPSAELPLMAATFGAEIVVAGTGGVRILPVAEFTLDMMTPAIEPDEIVTEIRFSPWPQGHGWGFAEYARRRGDFAIVAAAAMLHLDGDGLITRAALALGGVAPVPVRIGAAEAALLGERPSEALFARVARHCAEIEPLEDPVAPGWYRRKLAVSHARRVLEQAWAGTREHEGQQR